MPNTRVTTICITILCLVFCLSSVLSSETNHPYNISWSVLNEGGKTEEATSTSYRLKDAIGQPVIGRCESASYKVYIGFWTPKPLGVTGVEEEFAGYDTGMLVYSLSQNYPNPMSNVTQIEYAIPTANWISMRIYNITGQLVKTLVDELQEAGRYRISWNGRDDTGKLASKGIYFYKLKTGEFTATKKLTFLR